ncbi:MAG: hypothetical protein JWM49_1599 [Microbacteriaceae bacterium]|jgi:hypothetical protein|nr:hypothetical protein [Microbacteriaceae bacterium]
MSNTNNSRPDDSTDAEPIGTFDQTNGLVDGLDGDDGGALNSAGTDEGTGDAAAGSLFSDIVDPELADENAKEHGDGLPGETRYSEEGTP